jgi:membrane protein DedA with SNARE-associated domain
MESFLTSAGYTALILFGFLQAACIPISSEITFGFAGVLAYQGHLNLALIIILGTLAELAGSYASYAVGRVGGRPLVHKLGRYVLVTESDVDRAERFLEGRGAWAIPVGRMLPFVRAFTSIVAGLVRVPAIRFGVLSLIGTVLYVTVLASIGYAVGSTWQSVSHGLAVLGYVLFALIVLAIVGFIAYRWRQFRREAQASGQRLPGGPAPDEMAPEARPAPDGPAPGGSAPGGPAPGGSAPGGPAPGGSAPGGPAPGGSAPGGPAPGGPATEARPRPRSHRAGKSDAEVG